MKQHRNNGYAQKAMKLVEEIHGISNWELDTIIQERGIAICMKKWDIGKLER